MRIYESMFVFVYLRVGLAVIRRWVWAAEHSVLHTGLTEPGAADHLHSELHVSAAN